MKIGMTYVDGMVYLTAEHQLHGLVATAKAKKLGDAVKDLVSYFAQMQHDTIEALNASGIVHYVTIEVDKIGEGEAS